jgi:hypothetical protein
VLLSVYSIYSVIKFHNIYTFTGLLFYHIAYYFALKEEVILNILAKCYLFSLGYGTLSSGKGAGAWS